MRVSEIPAALAHASTKKSLSRAWRPGTQSCTVNDPTKRHPGHIDAELGLWPFCCKHYSADKKPEEMLEDVRHASHWPQFRRDDAHDNGCARNEPGGDAQYRLMHAMLLG
jgi:hypothetical protein